MSAPCRPLPPPLPRQHSDISRSAIPWQQITLSPPLHTPPLCRRLAGRPLHQLDYAALAAPPPGEVQAAWVGHASVLVQMEGVTFITDPVLSQRASPIQFVGPKR